MQEKRELLPGISFHSELNEILSLDVIGMAMEVQQKQEIAKLYPLGSP